MTEEAFRPAQHIVESVSRPDDEDDDDYDYDEVEDDDCDEVEDYRDDYGGDGNEDHLLPRTTHCRVTPCHHHHHHHHHRHHHHHHHDKDDDYFVGVNENPPRSMSECQEAVLQL